MLHLTEKIVNVKETLHLFVVHAYLIDVYFQSYMTFLIVCAVSIADITYVHQHAFWCAADDTIKARFCFCIICFIARKVLS